MTRRQTRFAIGLVILLHFVLALYLSPLGALDLDGDTWWQWDHVACGAILAQPVLLALWAAMAPQGIAVRLPRALELWTLDCLALACGSTLNMGSRDGGAVLTAFVWLLCFGLALAVLLPLRWLGWHAAANGNLDRGLQSSQFTLRRLLGWTFRVAVVAAALRWLDGPETALDEIYDALPLFFALGATGLLMAPVAAILAWLVFSARRRRVLKTFVVVSILVIAATAGGVCWYWYALGNETYQVSVMLAGFIASTAVTLMVFRLCGYSLTRSSAVENLPVTDPSGSLPNRRWRFALVLMPMLAAAVAFIAITPLRIEAWRYQAIWGYWRSLGWQADIDEGRLIGLGMMPQYESLAEFPASSAMEEARLRPLVGQPDLTTLRLKSTMLYARHIRYFTQIPNLRELVLDGSDVRGAATDDWGGLSALTTLSLKGCDLNDEVVAGLAHIPHLKKLTLRETHVTDAGVAALESCQDLAFVDLLFTHVTPTGVERLDDARPRLEIWATSTDPRLTHASLSFARQKILRNSSPASVVEFLDRMSRISWFRGNGPENDDNVFVIMQAHDRLEYLNLRGANITDAAVSRAKTLTGLKRLDLRDTHVTEDGLTELRQALPDCQILR
jgi:hypothetical protein